MQESLANASGAPIERPSETITTLIADLEGTSPTELTPPLYSAVDPEALDSLFHSTTSDRSRTPVSVHFRYHGYEVRVDGDGDITITSVDEER